MGTLMDQPPRNQRWSNQREVLIKIDEIKEISKKTKFTHDQVIEVMKLLEEERKSTVFVDNGDIHDEQMSGIGEILTEIQSSIYNISVFFSDETMQVISDYFKE